MDYSRFWWETMFKALSVVTFMFGMLLPPGFPMFFCDELHPRISRFGCLWDRESTIIPLDMKVGKWEHIISYESYVYLDISYIRIVQSLLGWWSLFQNQPTSLLTKPVFQRLRGCVPEWLVPDEHPFTWRVICKLGMYSELWVSQRSSVLLLILLSSLNRFTKDIWDDRASFDLRLRSKLKVFFLLTLKRCESAEIRPFEELSFNLHGSNSVTYLTLNFSGADYSQERKPPDNWEERVSCGHIYAGGVGLVAKQETEATAFKSSLPRSLS